MTVPAENVRTILNCNGSVTDFAFTFKIFSEGDIKIIATDSNGVETDLTITTDYTVTGENGAFENGGTVSTVKEIDGAMASYAYASGYTITILLDLEFKQETDLEYGGNYSSQALELMSDRLTKIIQQLAAKQIRAFRFKKSSQLSEMELPDPTAGYYLYSPDGISVDWITNVITGSTEATAFGKSLIDDADASAALTTLGLTTFIKTLMNDANAYTARKTLKTPLSRVSTVVKTAAYTVTSSDDGMLITVDATAGNIPITLPAVGDLWNGFTIGIKKTDSSSNYVESTPDGTENIDGNSSHILRLENSIAWYAVGWAGWKISSNNEIIGAMCVDALKDPAAGTAGLRTLGTTSIKACAGNDSRLARRTYLFTSNGNFTAQVSHCFVQLIGGGGGGGGGADGEGGGGGGGAGAMVEHQFQMTIGTTYNVVVGAGGPGGAHSGAGGATGGTGSASSITGVSNCSANGGVGGGGAGGGGGIGTGGAGGAIGIMPSSVGGDGSDSPGGRVGGAGGYNMHFSAGGAGGGPDTTPGYAGTGYGGGGGGGGSDAAANGSDGGAGSAGFVLITW